MIRFYCQYSYGGFRTYRINGSQHEDLTSQEVNGQHDFGFPLQCNTYFNYGGCRLIFRQLDNGELLLALREIPGVEKDTDGRTINCAVQFVGEADDFQLMYKLLLRIANDVELFQEEFVDGFSFQGGLHYDGIILSRIVEDLRKAALSAEGTPLSDITEDEGPIYLFVPSSPYFPSDRNLTEKVMKELSLATTKEGRKEVIKHTISQEQLNNLRGKISVQPESDTKDSGNENDKPEEEDAKEVIDETDGNEGPKATDETESNAETSHNDEAAPASEKTSAQEKALRITELEKSLDTEREKSRSLEIDRDELKRQLTELISKTDNKQRRAYLYLIAAILFGTAFVLTLILK